MAIYLVYATTQDLADYLYVALGDLPEESARLLARASELIYQLIRSNYNSDDEDNVEAVMLATCAQVEYWFTAGETISVATAFSQMSLGTFSFKLPTTSEGSNSSSNPSFSQRSIGYLEEQGLLFRGVKIR